MVIPARLHGCLKTGARVEVLLLSPIGELRWHVLARPARRLKKGAWVDFGCGLAAVVLAEHKEGIRDLEFRTQSSFEDALKRVGLPPLPPYIRREPRPEDKERYQTVYARFPGAVAAPTAGLHFDHETLSCIAQKGVQTAFLTLHVGLGTFRPITADAVEEHTMHAEFYEITPEAAGTIVRTRKEGGRIIAVGTTVVRALETAASPDGKVCPGRGYTDLFIYPGYTFRAVDAMLTNFHLPRSTLLVMIAAFAGLEFVRAAYREAVQMRYRFYSYGDCMLIL
jgi:S-adenosylmethionine:tRNA ribosyltransferase-isomerase